MPVLDQATTNSFTGNGVTTVFAYTFKLLDERDLLVEVDGVEQTLSTHYSVSGVGNSGGGNVTFVTAPANATTVDISRDMEFARATDYQENGDLQAETLDEDIDRVVMLAQQVRDQQNAGSYNFIQAGTGAATRTVQAKLRESVSVTDFGATGDGTTDDLASIQEGIDYLATIGGGELHFPQGDYKITDTIDVIAGNVMLVGRGGDNTHDVGTIGAQAATTLKWGGAAGGTMIKFSSPTGASAQKQNGGGVSGFYLDSNYSTNGAGIGIHLESWNSAEIKDVFCREFATACLKIDALAAGSLGDALDSQQNRVIGLTGRQFLAGGRFIWLDGNATASANASMNYFENCDVVVQGMGATQGAYDLGDCDNNVFVRCRAYAAAADDVVMFHAADDVGTARDNVFVNFSTNSNGAIKGNGTAEGANASSNNKFIAPDVANGAANPVVGTGATVGWDKSGTFTPAITFGGLSVGVTYGTQLGTYTRLNDRVFYDIYVVLTSKGSSTGAVAFTGLPFTAKNNGVYSAANIRAGALEVTATTAIEGYVAPNTAFVAMNKFAAGAATDLADTDVNAISSFVISGSYQVA